MSFVLLGILNAQAAGDGGVGIPAYDHISTTNITTNTASVTFSSLDTIAADYDHLELRFVATTSFTLGSDQDAQIVINGDETNSYTSHHLYSAGSSVDDTRTENAQSLALRKAVSNSGTEDDPKVGIVSILDFSNPNKNTSFRTLHGGQGNFDQIVMTSGVYKKTNAVTSILFRPSAGDFINGDRVSLYGIRGA